MKTLLRAGALVLAVLLCAPLGAQSDQYPDGNASSPCRHWATITPSDSAVLSKLPKAIYVGTGGDIAMVGADAPAGAAGVVWKSVPQGSILPVRPRQILAADLGTTAANIVACY